MRFRPGDTVEILREEGWQPSEPVRAKVVRRIQEKKGRPAYLLEGENKEFFALTWRTNEETEFGAGFHTLKRAEEIPDAEWSLGFVTARVCIDR